MKLSYKHSIPLLPATSLRPRQTRKANIAGTAMLAALFTAVGVTVPAAAQTIANGNFAAPSGAGGAATYGVSGAAVPLAFAWTVPNGNINHGTAPAGTACHISTVQCVELNGSMQGGIQQTIVGNPVAGQTYRVSFFMSRHSPLSSATMDALINGTIIANFVHNATLDAAGSWTPRYFDFVGTGAPTSLAFLSTTNVAGDEARGPQISGVTLEPVGCNCPYDIAVRKLHDGDTYFIRVTNPGPPIPVGSKIEVIDVVPTGLTLTVASTAPWTCTPTGNVVGPDAVTCTLLVTAPIATNASLPQLSFAGKGTPECPNCVRAKLYLQTPPATTFTLAAESNPDNNASCIK